MRQIQLRLRRRSAARSVTALVVAAAGGLAAAPGASAATGYAIGTPVCHPTGAKPSFCLAVKRTVVSASTPGARAYALAPAAGTHGPAGGYTPQDLATAYGFSPTAPTKRTIGIVAAFNDQTINNDLQVFDQQYGLSVCSESNGCLKVVGQTGTSTLPPDATNAWPTEVSLDVEMTHSACEHCKILLVEATTDDFSQSDAPRDMAIAEDTAVRLGATLITNSFAYPESLFTKADDAAFDHPGIVIDAGLGDDGWRNYDLLGVDGPLGSESKAPAILPTVTAVGGTSLYLTQTGKRQSETVWNDNGVNDVYQQALGGPVGAAGGGCSDIFTAQPWQTSVPGWAQTGCGTHRLSVDVSADADFLTGFDTYNSNPCDGACSTGWGTVGGTSMASPLITAMWALAGGSGGTPYPAANLYRHLGSASLYDVTTGGNGYCDGNGAAGCPDPNLLGYGYVDCAYTPTGQISVGDRSCDALKGYDGPSGVGTPNGLRAFRPTKGTAARSTRAARRVSANARRAAPARRS